MMKFLLLFGVLAACDLQPAPKQAPSAAGSAAAGSATGSAPTPAPPIVAAVDAGMVRPPPADAIQPTADCQQAGVKVAQLMIDSAEESQKPSIERERTNIVKTTEDACTKQGWTAPALACIAQSKTDRDAHACLEKFPPPGAAPAAGSAATPAPHPPRPPHRDPRKPS